MEIEEQHINIGEIVAAVRRRYRLLAVVALSIFLAGVALAIVLPSVYRSQAVILIERQEIPADLVRSTVTSFAAQRIQVMSQRAMSSSNLGRIMDQFDLYAEKRLREPKEEILEQMRSNISLEMISANVVDPKSGKPTEATIAFSLAFEHERPQKAQQVTNELATLFLQDNIRSRTESATQTTEFLDNEAETLRARVKEMEEKVARFKDKNTDSRPELEELTRSLMNRTELHLASVDSRIHETAQHKIYLEAEVAGLDPVLPDAGPRGSNAIEQLRSVEAALASAEAGYGPRHPDVIRLAKQAESMRITVDPAAARILYEGQITAARAHLNGLLEQYDATHPDVDVARRALDNLQQKLDALPPAVEKSPNNPAYIAMAARLDATNAQLISLEENREKLLGKLDAYTASLMSIPDAEVEFRALNRDYETALARYREISTKQMEARVSQNLEAGRKGERFTLIEPPFLPERPAKPNRPAIVIIAFVMGLVGGLGAISLAEAIDDKVHGRDALVEIFLAPPLATIPIFEVVDEDKRFRRYFIPASSATLAILIMLFAVHVTFMPLDVLWYTLLRKVGL